MEKKAKFSGREIAGFILLGLSLFMLGRSVMLCFSNDIWYDELFTVGMVEHSYGELVRFTAADVHPPLYYCIVKLFVDLCKLIMPEAGTVIPAKIVSVMPYFILMFYSVTLIRKRSGMLTAGLFSFCIVAMPQLSAYTVEMRMYGWALFFVTAAFLHARELILSYVNREPKPNGYAVGEAAGRQVWPYLLNAAALVLYGLAAAYTQYFACAAVGMVYLYVLIVLILQKRSGIRLWFFCVGVSAAGYVPWLFALAGQLRAVGENYWILPLTWRSLGGCVKFLMKPAFHSEGLNVVLAVVLFCGCGASVSYVVVRDLLGRGCSGLEMTKDDKLSHNSRVLDIQAQEKEKAVFVLAGIGVLAGVVVFGFAASILFRPVFVYRYMIPAAGCFWLSVAMAVGELCKSKRFAELDDELCKLEMSGKPDYELCKLKNGRPAAVTRTAACTFLILLVIIGLRDYRAFMGEEEYKVVCMRETQTALSLIGPEDDILYNFDQVQAVTGYFLPQTAKRYLWRVEGEKLIQEITSPCGTVEDVDQIRTLLRTAKEEGEYKDVWFIGSFNSREDIVKEWQDAGLEVEQMGSFLLERYWFNLYKISDSDHTI